ncbi:MAG: hypothetical protein O7G32_10620 [SAR324 cluster bacterium]|nr:hypothetical protein [SAR324 cluster bacterium]
MIEVMGLFRNSIAERVVLELERRRARKRFVPGKVSAPWQAP